MGVVYGLMAALSWGVADFLAGNATRRLGTYRTLFYMQLPGLFALSIYLAVTGTFGRWIASGDGTAWAWALLSTGVGIAATIALYQAFEIGMLALVSPISASYAMVTVVLAILSGEHLSTLHALGIAITLAGVLLAAVHLGARDNHPAGGQHGHRRIPPGAGLAMVAATGYGFSFWVLGIHVSPHLSAVGPVWLGRLATPLALGAITRRLSSSLAFPARSLWPLVLAIGIVDTIGFVAATTGFTTGQVAIVSVVASLFSTITVVLAWIFFHERLRPMQWAGIACIFAGVALVST